jgi:hypothetical protein
MGMPKRNTMIAAGAGIVIVASVVIGYLLSGPGRAGAPDDALRAADALRKEVSGTSGSATQPTNDNGVPKDAQGTPAIQAGRVETGPKK